MCVIIFLLLIQNITGNQRIFDRVLKFLSRAIPFLFGIKVKISGQVLLDPGKTYVFMANHVNIFDGFILYGNIPHFVRGVELEDHFSWPVWGTLITQLGNIPISQKNTKEALTALAYAAEKIRQGTSIIILPEGHRTQNGHLLRFSRGPFIFAQNAGVDIVPIAMKGAWERKTLHSLMVRPGTVEVRFGNIISASEIASCTAKELRDRTRQKILGLLEE